jgi:hypothetical protein
MQHTGARLHTTENLLLFLNKLPISACKAHHTPDIINNLLSASEIADTRCKFFHKTGCEITHNGEIILQGWKYVVTKTLVCLLTTRWRPMNVPQDTNNIHDRMAPLQANNIYECKNTQW